MYSIVTVFFYTLHTGNGSSSLSTGLAKLDSQLLALKKLITTPLAAPEIINIIWGTVTIKHADGSVHTYQDARITPMGSQKWDWTAHVPHAHHKPGILIADVADIINYVDIIVLSRGMQLVLEIPQETIDYIRKHGKTLKMKQSEKAVRAYNKLAKQGKRVAALIHSTC